MADTVWSGTLGFDSLERTFLPNLPNRSDSDDSLGHKVTADSYTMYRKYVEGASNVGNRVDLANFSVSPLGSQTQTATVEFDFEASKMPVTTAGSWIDNYIACHGMVVDLLDGTSKDLVFGISNSESGLVFNLNNNSNQTVQTVALHKKLHEKFHVRINWLLDGKVELYIDDQLTETLASTRQKANWSASGTNTLMFNLCTDSAAPAADGSDDYEVTVSNVRVGNTLGKSVLDTMTFADIAGENVSADGVFSNLNLPQTWSNGQINNAALTWTSSNPSVITNEGVVTAAEVNQTVTLTASLVANPSETKSFDVTVNQIPLTAYAASKDITVDGILDETAWLLPYSFAVKQEGVNPLVYTAWREQNVYIAVSGIGSASSMSLQIGETSWAVDLTTGSSSSNGLTAAVKDGIVEMKIDMAAAGIAIADYQEVRGFQITLICRRPCCCLQRRNSIRFFTVFLRAGEWFILHDEKKSSRNSFSGAELFEQLQIVLLLHPAAFVRLLRHFSAHGFDMPVHIRTFRDNLDLQLDRRNFEIADERIHNVPLLSCAAEQKVDRHDLQDLDKSVVGRVDNAVFDFLNRHIRRKRIAGAFRLLLLPIGSVQH